MNITRNLVCRTFLYIKKIKKQIFSLKFCMHPLFPAVYNTLPHFINLTVLGDYSEARRCVISWTAELLTVYFFFSGEASPVCFQMISRNI